MPAGWFGLNPWWDGLIRLLIIVGLVAISSSFIATLATVLAVGSLLLVGGAVQIVSAFWAGRWRGFWLHLLVGLLYGAMLPMLPRHPILLGGVIAPILWSGMIHSFLEVVDPVLNKRVSWPWFVVSQIGFGIVAGIVVSWHHRIRTWQHLPFLIRAGIETPGAMEERDREDRRQ